ncbi:MAG: hypothetical protein FWG50_13545, partial [Kiritimatiellaeota bacterium]|nr:hypothetical protein [Kiritimatiellota bacterium]
QIPAGLTAGKGDRKARRGIREIEASGSAGLPPCLSFGKAEALRPRHNAATDYVRSNQTVMTYSDLQGINGKLYLEAINPSVNWSDIRIVVSLSVDGGSTWVASNAVRVTSMRCNFTVGVVRQFSIVNGARTPFVPDYSTPAACLRKAADAQIATQEYFGSPLHYEDPWRHDGDATLGHGFAYFQYEGPDLGNTLSTICANSVYDKKDYFGKTGQSGFTHWHYCKAVRNTQKQLAWWDVCDDTISGKYLVLKKTYTLRPDRLSKMHGDFMMDMGFPENGLYGYFGLHIDIINSGWGCLSNVGLTMELNNLDAANICDCKKNLTMPTTANKSVWKILKGTELLHRRSGFSVSPVLTGVIDAIVEESQGLDWGDTKALTQGAGGTLQGKLFNVLQGKDIVIPVEDGSRPFLVTDRVIIKVMSIGDIAIDDNATEFLEYYDPGLFPEVFGEQPESVFNMGDN